MNRAMLIDQINEDFLERLKSDPDYFTSITHNTNDSSILFILERLGRLENKKCKEPLLSLLKNSNDNIRALSLKNLAKLIDVSLLPVFYSFATEDESTAVRREAVSAIGRLRNEQTIPFLIELLQDKDPKVVMQAIRGLLVFSGKPNVKIELMKLKDHPNELIREVINREFNSINSQTIKKQKHDEFPEILKNVVVHGDVLDVLKYVPDESVHLTFTSPPYYNARDYSIYQSYEEYLNFLDEVFKQVYRITKEGRFFILNTSPIIIPRISRQHSSKRYPIPYDIHPFLVKMGW